MLVLSRQVNETIIIDGCIEIQLLRVKGNSVRLGITAPRHVPIRRAELAGDSHPPQPHDCLPASGPHVRSRSETRNHISQMAEAN